MISNKKLADLIQSSSKGREIALLFYLHMIGERFHVYIDSMPEMAYKIGVYEIIVVPANVTRQNAEHLARYLIQRLTLRDKTNDNCED